LDESPFKVPDNEAGD